MCRAAVVTYNVPVPIIILIIIITIIMIIVGRCAGYREEERGSLGVDVEVVGGARVFVVVNGRSEQAGHHLQLRQPVLIR